MKNRMYSLFFKAMESNGASVVFLTLFAQTIFIPLSPADSPYCYSYVGNNPMGESGSISSRESHIPYLLEKHPFGPTPFTSGIAGKSIEWNPPILSAGGREDQVEAIQRFREKYDSGSFEHLYVPYYVAFEAKFEARFDTIVRAGPQFGILKGFTANGECIVDVWVNGTFLKATLEDNELQSTRESDFARTLLTTNRKNRFQWTRATSDLLSDGYIHNQFDARHRYIQKKGTELYYSIFRIDFDGSVVLRGKHGAMENIKRESLHDYIVSSRSRKHFTGHYFVWDEIPRNNANAVEYENFRKIMDKKESGFFDPYSDDSWVIYEANGSKQNFLMKELTKDGDLIGSYFFGGEFDGPHEHGSFHFQKFRMETEIEKASRKRMQGAQSGGKGRTETKAEKTERFLKFLGVTKDIKLEELQKLKKELSKKYHEAAFLQKNPKATAEEIKANEEKQKDVNEAIQHVGAYLFGKNI